MPKLTKKFVESAEPKDRPYEIMDSELRGFGLRVRPACARTPGGVRAFFVRVYPRGSGREQKVNVGTFGVISVDQAREMAIQIIARSKSGEDVGFRPKPTALTVAELSAFYLDQHVMVHGTESTQRTAKSLFNRHVIPQYGDYDVESIDFATVAKHHAIVGKDHPEVANRMVTMLAAALAWGTSHGHRQSKATPCKWDKRGREGVKKFPEQSRERFLTDEQVEALETALRNAERIDGKRKGAVKVDTCELIRLFLYTGARFSELHKITWSFVDLENRKLRLYQTKEKRPKFIPLSDGAYEILVRHKARRNSSPSDRVFDCYNPQRAWMYIIRPAAGLGATDDEKAFVLHGFRHNLASAGLNDGLSLRTIGQLLGHSSEKTTARYAHFADQTLTDAMQRIGDKIKKKN
jgi:integrase